MTHLEITEALTQDIPQWPWITQLTSEEVRAASNKVINTNYDIDKIGELEAGYMWTALPRPAIRNEHIPEILEIIKQIVGATDIQSIHNFLNNTSIESTQARIDLQKCWAILNKIAWIQDKAINWNTIFSRLQLDSKKAA